MSSSAEPVGSTNNWAVLACTSSYWFNYRHLSNVLSMYFIIRRLGIPDDRIILMNSLDSTCDARNPFPGDMYSRVDREYVLGGHDPRFYKHLTSNNTWSYSPSMIQAATLLNLDTNLNIEVDYRGEEVGVESFLRLLTGRHEDYVPLSKRLRSDEHSNVLVFLSGHGGDEFFKFRDADEMSTQDIGYALHEMSVKGRYKELLLIVDTCQAATLANAIVAPRVIAIGSSRKGENSYSYEANSRLSVAVVDRFSHSVNEFFRDKIGIIAGNHHHTDDQEIQRTNSADEKRVYQKLLSLTLQDLLNALDPNFLYSQVGVTLSPGARHPRDVPLMDFFGDISTFQKSKKLHVAATVLTDHAIADEIAAMTDIQKEPLVVYPFQPPPSTPRSGIPDNQPLHTDTHYPPPPPRTYKHCSPKNPFGRELISYMLAIGTFIYGSSFLFDWLVRPTVQES